MPVMGIVASEFDETFGIKKNYLEFASNFGTPMLLTPMDKKVFFDAYKKIDALILPGGNDVNSRTYGQFPGFFNTKISPFLEYFDNEILPDMLGKIPIFGICRGLQIINVKFGGTLNQNLFFKYPMHNYSSSDEDLVHEVIPATKLKFKVNSFHHQCINLLGEGLSVEASSNDGIIEAISFWDKKIFCVQWHPERFFDVFSGNAFNKILS